MMMWFDLVREGHESLLLENNMEWSGTTSCWGEAEHCRQEEQDMGRGNWKNVHMLEQSYKVPRDFWPDAQVTPRTLLSQMLTETFLSSSRRDLLGWILGDQERNQCDVSLNFWLCRVSWKYIFTRCIFLIDDKNRASYFYSLYTVQSYSAMSSNFCPMVFNIYVVCILNMWFIK